MGTTWSCVCLSTSELDEDEEGVAVKASHVVVVVGGRGLISFEGEEDSHCVQEVGDFQRLPFPFAHLCFNRLLEAPTPLEAYIERKRALDQC